MQVFDVFKMLAHIKFSGHVLAENILFSNTKKTQSFHKKVMRINNKQYFYIFIFSWKFFLCLKLLLQKLKYIFTNEADCTNTSEAIFQQINICPIFRQLLLANEIPLWRTQTNSHHQQLSFMKMTIQPLLNTKLISMFPNIQYISVWV